MREYTSRLTLALPTQGSLVDDIVLNAQDHPDSVSLSRRDGDTWTEVTAAAFLEEVRAVTGGLVAAGIQSGDRVALLSKTRYEWTLLDYAIWFAGAVTVPVYETASAEQIAWIVSDSGAKAMVVESTEHRLRVEGVRDGAPALEHVWTIDDDAIAVLTSLGSEVSADELERRRSDLSPDSLATIIYTSGTTGQPKGCVLTHGNFMVELSVAIDELDGLFAVEDASTLLFLPLTHVFARIIQIGAIKARVRLGHSADMKGLVNDLEKFAPTFILAVPRVFEKVFNTASQKAAVEGRGPVFDRAVDTAIAFSRALDRGRPGIVLRARHRLFERLVYRHLRAALGGRCVYAISGGAPLGERLGHFFRGVGVTILEGYGLTETTAALTVNLPDAIKIGTVGRPLGGTSVQVAPDGELLVRGGQVFQGYWQNEQATSEAFENGWFRTGDLGEIDDEGFVRVTGRKKEILVTAGGKNVAPALLEDLVRAHPLVSQCMVVGDGQPFIAALVTIDPQAFAGWAQLHGKRRDIAGLTEDPDLRAEVQAAVDAANHAVSRAEAIRRFVIMPREWTEEGGHLTPSLKVKRHVVLRQFRDEVASLFGS